MRSFVFTLGFHEDFILQRLSRKAAQPGERVLVLTASPVVGGVRSAFNSLVEQCGRLGLGAPELVALDLTDEAWALAELINRLRGLEEPIVADLSGGMRALCVLALLALLLSGRRFELYVVAEGGEAGELHLPAGVARALSSLSREKVEILREIARSPGVSVEVLARRLGRSLKTVRNHLSELKSMGLVSSRGRGAPLELTRWGLVLAGVPRESRELAAKVTGGPESSSPV
ncbi:MAG: CRISPR-associated CARF protein Csa3 [Thermofilaceae archaeon]